MGALDFLRVHEVAAMIKVKSQYSKQVLNLRPDQDDLRFCYEVLKDVSRSFAAVIIQLHDELRDAVCLFYLVLRALDTVEDDMSIPVPTKKELLPVFHEKLELDDYRVMGIGKGQERALLENFPRMAREFRALKKPYQVIIADICHRMAMGMCHYLENTVETKRDYDMYCHYVAGLVGHGLTRLFAVSGLENPRLADDLTMANSMGLFLQKANIIRDYYEDILEDPPRIFWPREIWGIFTKDLHSFRRPECQREALECLNAMVTDALKHVPDCIEYMASLKEPSVFLFCAIPQVMAIATLNQLYNNPVIFNAKVKIRKGQACDIILHSTNFDQAVQKFYSFLLEIEGKLAEEDPSYDKTREAIDIAKAHITSRCKSVGSSYARSFLTSYPALGGQLLYSIVDSVNGMFAKRQ